MISLSNPVHTDRNAGNETRIAIDSMPADETEFSEWFGPSTLNTERLSKQTPIDPVGNTTAPCQGNGALTLGHGNPEDSENRGDGAENGTNQSTNTGKDNNNNNDNGILASLMASYTTRDKNRLYGNIYNVGIPEKELARLAYTLHESAIAGKPTMTLGIAIPELGEIRFDVQIAGKVVFIHAFVDNERTAAALALAVSSLRDRLEEQRLILGRLDVTSPGRQEPPKLHNEKRSSPWTQIGRASCK